MAKKCDMIYIETWRSEIKRKQDVERKTGRTKVSRKSVEKIRNAEFSQVLNDHCKDIDESCWEVLEMQHFGTVSGTVRCWRFGCDGQAKFFLSHLGAYEPIWRVVTYSKKFFQEFKKSIQWSKSEKIQWRFLCGFSREGKETFKAFAVILILRDFHFHSGEELGRELYLLVKVLFGQIILTVDFKMETSKVQGSFAKKWKNSGDICQSKLLLSNFELFFVWEPQKFI